MSDRCRQQSDRMKIPRPRVNPRVAGVRKSIASHAAFNSGWEVAESFRLVTAEPIRVLNTNRARVAEVLLRKGHAVAHNPLFLLCGLFGGKWKQHFKLRKRDNPNSAHQHHNRTGTIVLSNPFKRYQNVILKILTAC